MSLEMQFELEVEDGPGSLAHGAVALNDMLPEDIRKKVQDLAGPVDYFSEEVSRKVHSLRSEILSIGHDHDHMCKCHARCKMLAKALHEEGYPTRIVRAGSQRCPQSNNKPGTFFKNMHHVSVQTYFRDSPRIIEWRFKDYFQTSKPTQRYNTVLDNIDQVFVGTKQQLKDLLKLLCVELHMSFCQQGQELPPWRRMESMMSRWIPASPHFEIIGSPTLDFGRDSSIHNFNRATHHFDRECMQHEEDLTHACSSTGCPAPRRSKSGHQPLRSSLSRALQRGDNSRKSQPTWLASPIFVVGKAGVIRAAG